MARAFTRSILVALLAVLVCARSSAAQQVHNVKVIVTVIDPSGAVVQGATVTIVGLDAATKAGVPRTGKTTDKGTIVVEGMPAGRYSIQAEFPGFELGLLRDVSIRDGDNKHVVVMPLKGVTDSITVTAGVHEAASSRTGPAFRQSLTREEVEAFSDDPAEMERQLSELAGPNAVVRVDSFEGASLPPKAQIKSIHVTRDQFAAETASPGSTFVDVITQAGAGAWKGAVGMNFQDGDWNARSPFTPTRGQQQNQNINGNLGGAIVKNKADFSLSVSHYSNYTTPTLNANLPSGRRSEVMRVRQTGESTSVLGLFNYAITRDQTLRLGYLRFGNAGENLGIGQYDLAGRAYSYNLSFHTFRIQEAGPIGRRFFINTRLLTNWSDDEYRSVTEAPTVVVQDEFTSGGAQRRGGTHQLNYAFASDLDYIRGIHSWRTGIDILGSRYSTDALTNYLGTYTFASLDAFNAGVPLFYMREIGDPSFWYTNVQGAVYLQDDVRVSKALTLSPGVRYSRQTHVNDRLGIEPRFGMTWSPFKGGGTTLRASAGIFHGFMSNGVYEQTIRYDGTHQRQLIINNPSYPDPGDTGVVPATNRYLIEDFRLNKNVRYSGGIDHRFSQRVRVSFLYAYMHQMSVPRGKNLNAPVDGVRPYPLFANVIESVTDAEIRRHDVTATVNVNLSPGGAAGNRAKVNWRRLTINGNFNSVRGRRNALGAFSVPASGTLETEWGPVPATLPWGAFVGITSTQVRDLTVNLNLNTRGYSVYTETTGLDDNQDGLLNDRRPGVGLNSLHAANIATLSGRVQYAIGAGGRRSAPDGNAAAGAAAARYRVNLFLNINNVTNRSNYDGYSGALTSSNYGKPTSVRNPRSLSIGMNVGF